MTSWSPEVDMLAKIYDRLGGVQHAIVAVQIGSQKAGQMPKPHPRPRTAMEEARQSIRREKHEQLANRMLPHRKRRQSPPGDG